ncbi:MAG: aspartate kinase [Alphaproteobacteria bacterium]|nr:aspartate kinase [Alphaproteobacteria bacterium]
MARIVQKFGGTSVADIARLEAVSLKIKKEVDAGHHVAVVVSAMAGVTNRLVGYAQSLAGPSQSSEYDVIIAAGEQITSGLLALALNQIGIPARSLLAWQIPILTDHFHGSARIKHIDPTQLEECWSNGMIPVIAGFQGLAPDGRLTTLGRGGSDTTAVALAAALKADRCDIYTDVTGVYTADPRIVPKARKLKEITYEEMFELSAQGAKVLQTRSVETAMVHQVHVQVLSSFHEESGTRIVPEKMLTDSMHVSGITHKGDEARVTIKNMCNETHVIADIIEVLANSKVHIDMIVQNVSINDQTDLTFTVQKGEIPRVVEALKEMKEISFDDLILDPNVAKITVVGVGVQRRLGIASLMFKTLAEMGIPLQVISCSAIKVSVLVDESLAEEAVRTLHRAYGLDVETEQGVLT